MVRQQGLDSGRVRRAMSNVPETYVKVATVGHRDRNPAYARIEESQVWVECTVQPDGCEVVARLGLAGAGDGYGSYVPLDMGCRVLLEYPDGDPNDPVIAQRLNDATYPMPDAVAGMSTGQAGATTPGAIAGAPQFHFIKTRAGHLFALETGEGGDVLHHAGGSIELKVGDSSAIHLDGTVHLGEGFATPPVPGSVAPGNQQTAATPGVPHEPTPVTAQQNPLTAAQGKPADAIVRLKDGVLSNASIDTAFWGWVAAVSAFLDTASTTPTLAAANAAYKLAMTGLSLVPAVGPTSQDARHNTSGAKHTASD